ncbi:saccharopine dehydrogenase [Actinosynnema sp. CS-041913]|uniref:saccharopine dehydrogenase n=1 Tax=Actinosynnema sp. CS-041913 TaxID=3239917 RepID=UPI003D8CED4E
MKIHVWIRGETRTTEQRAPIVPDDARALVAAGCAVTVEDSPQRVFPIEDYAEAGCRIVTAGSWVDAPPDTFVIGLKELPDQPAALAHRHVFFGHVYKGQPGAEQLLRRFTAGGGTLLDLEYLVDEHGRRLAAFGFWAGYLGAALAVLHHGGLLSPPLRPMSRDGLDEALRQVSGGDLPEVLVVGALGRSGRGARAALEVAGIAPTCWDLAETRELDRAALLGHDVLVNAALSTGPAEPLLRPADLADPARRLSVVGDVSCDVGGPYNLLPVYDHTTSWEHPVRRLGTGSPPLDVIAIDNLPSLLAVEASVDFSRDLLPHLLTLGTDAPQWRQCAGFFHTAVEASADTGVIGRG